MAQKTSIFLLQHLDFVIYLKNLILSPVQEMEFLGLQINSLNMTFTLPEETVLKIKSQSQEVLQNSCVAPCKLISLRGSLYSTAKAVVPAFVLRDIWKNDR